MGGAVERYGGVLRSAVCVWTSVVVKAMKRSTATKDLTATESLIQVWHDVSVWDEPRSLEAAQWMLRVGLQHIATEASGEDEARDHNSDREKVSFNI